jgi:hypothetical protein
MGTHFNWKLWIIAYTSLAVLVLNIFWLNHQLNLFKFCFLYFIYNLKNQILLKTMGSEWHNMYLLEVEC